MVTTVAAFLAAGCCVATGLRARTRARAAWWLLGSSAGSWGAGQAHWSVNELLLHNPVPFPSLADAGFLGFPVLAAAGLWLTAGRAITSASRLRAGMDGALVAAGVFTASWTMVLGPVYRGGADTPFAVVISVAYPVGDVLLVALSLLLLSRVRGRRPLRPGGGDGVVSVRVSVGIAGIVPGADLDSAAEMLMRTADHAMYADKTVQKISADV